MKLILAKKKNKRLLMNYIQASKLKIKRYLSTAAGGRRENFLLVLSSFALIGIAPALIKFYKRTIERDKHFGYLKIKAASLAEETLKLANAIEVDSRLKPK